jgi:hypothetical protein
MALVQPLSWVLAVAIKKAVFEARDGREIGPLSHRLPHSGTMALYIQMNRP